MITHIPLGWYFNLYRWQDIAEVIFLSIGIFYLSHWLAQDQHKPLLRVFYGYCFIILATFYLQMNTANTLFITFLPLIVAVFILIHHETLQKNFISLHTITPLKISSDDWLKALIRTGLITAGNNTEFIAIVEKKEALDTFFTGGTFIDAPISLALLQTVTTSALYQPKKLVWIDAHARLKAFNIIWHQNTVDAWFTQEVKALQPWLSQALFFTNKSDALVIAVNQQSRTFSLIFNGTLIEHLSAHNAYLKSKQYLGYSFNPSKGDLHGFFTKNNTQEHHLS